MEIIKIFIALISIIFIVGLFHKLINKSSEEHFYLYDTFNNVYDVPDDLNNMCNVFTCGRDYGPGTKFFPTILREQETNTIIIMLDDDYIYGYDFIETLLNENEKEPESAIIMNEAMLIKPEFIDTSVLYTNKKYIDNEWIKKYIKSPKKYIDYGSNLRSFMM